MTRNRKPIPARPGTTALPGAKRTRPNVVSQNIANNTELTLMMPVKPGFIPMRDTVTYATRARLLMNAFNGFRQLSREAADLHPFADVVERIKTIQSYRLNLLESDTKLMLAVSFDQPWEPYIRHIWRDTGPFLDSILCNCIDYERHASSKGFEAFAEWVRKTQVATDFFYIADNLTVEDRKYLEITERLQREGDEDKKAIEIARTRLPDIERRAQAERQRDPAEAIAIGLRALGVLYRLNDYYPEAPGVSDSTYYHHAVRRLLDGFKTELIDVELRKGPFKAELEWYEQVIKPPRRPKPRPMPKPDNVQGGILNPYPGITHGALLLMRVVDRDQACKFIKDLPLSFGQFDKRTRTTPRCNIAFTYSGLVQLEVDPSEIVALPQEFKEGMQSRAGMLGDLRCNHPSNWNLPARHGTAAEKARLPVVQTQSIDFVVQLRISDYETSPNVKWGRKHPLFGTVAALLASPYADGVQLLSLQPMAHQRDRGKRYKHRIREHFGFLDGLSQPDIVHDPKHLGDEQWHNEVALGDVLIGHTNSYGDPAYPPERRNNLMDNGSFLVIRKLKQDVARFNALEPREGGGRARERMLAKMMGRFRNGKPLVPFNDPDTQNDFDYAGDRNGDRCPLHSHIRRTNPREVTAVVGADRGGMIQVPRLVRRGMSYGPRYTKATASQERGLVFMAYNASIAEQFEIVQRWVNGANSTGGFSGQSDPFLGTPERGTARTFRYVDGKEVEHVAIDDPQDPQPLVKLEWGLYLFAPSAKALDIITQPVGRPNLAARGERIIQELKRREAIDQLDFDPAPHEVSAFNRWKALLEDLEPARQEEVDAVWAAIRANHNGVLRTPFGVLLGKQAHVREVLGDDGQRFSVRRYWWRLRKSFGDIYLSMDPRPKAWAGDPTRPKPQRPYHKQVRTGEYARRARDINALINSFSEEWAFEQAYQIGAGYLAQLPKGVQGNLRVRNLVDVVLGMLSKAWFGIPDGKRIQVAGEPTIKNPRTLHCPYHFITSSRYAFSPNPSAIVADEGNNHGSRLQATTEAWVRQLKGNPKKNPTPIGGPMFELLGHKPAQLASELIGVMHGFLPSTLGNVLRAVAVWTDDGNLWRMQEDYLAATAENTYARANAALRTPLMRTMQYRPMPAALHRLVVDRNVTIGGEKLGAGDVVVLGVDSASQELLDQGKTDVTWVFGGDYCPYDKKSKRSGKNGATHGCPGQKIAMGVLLGITASLLDAGQITAEPAPLIFTVG